MCRLIFIITFVLSSPLTVYAGDIYIEVNQMMALNLGVEVSNGSGFGFRGAVGSSPFSLKCITYNMVLFYSIPYRFKNIEFSIEGGLLLAYFDFLENRYVDWDPVIDSPYAGWLEGVAINMRLYNSWMLRFGISYWTEWEEGYGFKHGFIPVVSIGYILI